MAHLEHDTHMELLHRELAKDPELVCGTCGGPAEGNFSDEDGWVCDACMADAERTETNTGGR